MDPNTLIWKKFLIAEGDHLPFSPGLLTANRNHLAELFFELGYTRGAEIGVEFGRFSRVLLGSNPNLTLLCVDPWTAYSRASQRRQNKYYAYVQNKLAPYKHELIRKTSMDALTVVPDESLDFVYIDAAHDFDNVMKDIIGWVHKVKKGGIVSGHDYCNFYDGGVVYAVNAYTQAHNIQQWYVTREHGPSFFWVK